LNASGDITERVKKDYRLSYRNSMKKNKKKENKNKKTKKKKVDLFKELKFVYRSLPDRKNYVKKNLFPIIFLGIIIIILPIISNFVYTIPLVFDSTTFIFFGLIVIILGFLYPYINWKNRESDINGKIHFFITHLRVLSISDLTLKDIMRVLSKNKAYKSLGEEIRKISVLSDQWRVPMGKSFLFIAQRTPSKILRDFLDRFSQSLDSGVDHREFIEAEQDAVLEEYKTMYEASNENITILNEVYVSLLIAIIFVMSLGIVLPIIIGAEDMNTFLFLSSFLLIISEGLLLYLLKSMVPPDEIWHLTGDKGKMEMKLKTTFTSSIFFSIILLLVLFFVKSFFSFSLIGDIPIEIVFAISITPLILPGLETIRQEVNISRKDRNFLSFLNGLGSISTMRGGKITDSVYYLSKKDYGILTVHIKSLFRRLRTRIDDDKSWEWFGIDTGSNYIQRSSEMFREATSASANPRKVSRMITQNIRKIRDLRVKKMSVVNTSAALFAGITFGIAFSIYTSLVIARHLNKILIEGMSGDPFSESQIDVGAVLNTVPPEVFSNNFIIIFIVLVIHCFMLALTIRTLRGSHIFITLLYFVPFVWVVAITGTIISVFLGGFLGG
jgi:flagellar protein FlaJ